MNRLRRDLFREHLFEALSRIAWMVVWVAPFVILLGVKGAWQDSPVLSAIFWLDMVGMGVAARWGLTQARRRRQLAPEDSQRPGLGIRMKIAGTLIIVCLIMAGITLFLRDGSGF